MRKVTGAALVAAAVAGVVIAMAGCKGCGYDEKKPLAVIDGKNIITVGDFVYHYKRAVEMAPFQSKPVINTYEDAKDFLDDIVMSRVLEMEADALGYGKDANIVKEVESFRSNKLREHTQREIEDGVKVTEAEILDFYNKNKEWRRGAYIVCDKKDRAEQAYAALTKGTPWDQVVKEYTLDEESKKTGGAVPQDIFYSGDNVSRAVYAAPIGKYTPVIASEAGDYWFIFRVDKKVPGQKEEYAKVKDSIRDAIKKYKVEGKMREATAKWRKEAKIVVDQEIYNAMFRDPTKEVAAKYNRKDKVISTVGGVPIYFDTWYEGAFIQLRTSEAGMDELKKTKPEEFKRAMDRRLQVFQDQALLEYAALKKGVDKQEDFIREVNKSRAGMMVDKLYEKQFLPQVPPITEEEIKAYFDSHKAEFQEPERADIFFFALPEKTKADEFNAQVKGGADPMAVANDFMKGFQEEMAKKEPPKEPPAESSLPYMDMITIGKEPPPLSPGAAPGSNEPPVVTEVRPSVFKAKEGDVSAVFRLKDGRWAFFKYVKYYALVQHPLTEPDVYQKAKESATKDKMASPAVDRMCQQWFDKLRAKHKITIDESALKMAYKKAQKL